MEMVNGRICLSVESAEVYEWTLFVENTGQDVVDFTYYSPLHWIPCFVFEDSKKVTRSSPLSLCPGENKLVFTVGQNQTLDCNSACKCLTASVVLTRWKVWGCGEVPFEKCGTIPGYGGLWVQVERGAKPQAIPHCALYWSWVQHTASTRAGTHRALHTLQTKQRPN